MSLASAASSAGVGGGRDSLDGGDTGATMADSLWEDEAASVEAALLRSSGSGANGTGEKVEDLATQQRRAAGEDPPESPAFAKGTGMVRSVSGGVRVVSGGAGPAPAGTPQDDGADANPFSKILGRMSGEATR